jgi:hypothetical protein
MAGVRAQPPGTVTVGDTAAMVKRPAELVERWADVGYLCWVGTDRQYIDLESVERFKIHHRIA